MTRFASCALSAQGSLRGIATVFDKPGEFILALVRKYGEEIHVMYVCASGLYKYV